MIFNRKLINWIGCIAICVGLASNAWGQDKVDFVKQIKPIFEKHCVSCHGPDEDKYEAFRIDIREEAFDYIEEESAEDSDIYLVMVDEDEDVLMPPPDDNNPVSKENIELVKKWIDEGAEWPEGLQLNDGPQEEEGSEVVIDDEAKEEVKIEEPAQPKEAPKKEKAEIDPETQQIFNAVGSLHTASVHLPIGLLLGAGLFALLSLRGNFVMSDCAYYCLWLGTFGAIAACVSGWYYAPMEHHDQVTQLSDLFDPEQKIFWHRSGGLVMSVAALLLALFAANARNKDPDDGMVWKLGAILLACGIGWVGSTGGKLVYPKQYKDLNAVYNRVVESITGSGAAKEGDATNGDDADKEKAGETSPKAEAKDVGESAESEVGKASDE